MTSFLRGAGVFVLGFCLLSSARAQNPYGTGVNPYLPGTGTGTVNPYNPYGYNPYSYSSQGDTLRGVAAVIDANGKSLSQVQDARIKFEDWQRARLKSDTSWPQRSNRSRLGRSQSACSASAAGADGGE